MSDLGYPGIRAHLTTVEQKIRKNESQSTCLARSKAFKIPVLSSSGNDAFKLLGMLSTVDRNAIIEAAAKDTAYSGLRFHSQFKAVVQELISSGANRWGPFP